MVAAGESHDVAARAPRDLANDAADGAGGGGHHDRLSRLRCTDAGECEKGGQPGDSKDADRRGQRRLARIDAPQDLLIGGNTVILPTEPAVEMLADRDTGLL